MTVVLTAVAGAPIVLPVMGIPQWLRGIYQDGREQKGWTAIEDMARTYGFKQSTLYRWMVGDRQPDVISCLKLARAFGTPARDVLRMAGHGDDTRDLLGGMA